MLMMYVQVMRSDYCTCYSTHTCMLPGKMPTCSKLSHQGEPSETKRLECHISSGENFEPVHHLNKLCKSCLAHTRC